MQRCSPPRLFSSVSVSLHAGGKESLTKKFVLVKFRHPCRSGRFGHRSAATAAGSDQGFTADFCRQHWWALISHLSPSRWIKYSFIKFLHKIGIFKLIFEIWYWFFFVRLQWRLLLMQQLQRWLMMSKPKLMHPGRESAQRAKRGGRSTGPNSTKLSPLLFK